MRLSTSGRFQNSDLNDQPERLSWFSIDLYTEKLPVQLLVRTHTWVANSIPSWDTYRR